MKSYEQIAKAMYEVYNLRMGRFQKPQSWAGLGEAQQRIWISAAQEAHKEITEVH